jgi:hypothetical protein
VQELPNTAGYGAFFSNQNAKIQNMGGEFTLMTRNIQTKNVSWTSSATFSIQRNKLLAGFPNLTSVNYIDPNIGQPFYGWVSVNQSQGVDPQTGLYQFIDLDGKTTSDVFAALSQYRLTYIPQYFGGISNTFKYKGLSVDLFLQYTKQKGINYIYDPIFFPGPGFLSIGSGGISGGNQPKPVVDYWQQASDKTRIQKPSTLLEITSLAWEKAKNSDLSYSDASFIRVKTLAISYSMPNSWKEKNSIRELKFFLQGQNLWTITNYKGTDPETQSVGSLPPLRVITAGIQVGL